MKEYTITMSLTVNTSNLSYKKLSQFAEELSETIKSEHSDDDVEIVDVNIIEIEDLNDYDEEYLDEDDEY